MKNLFLAALVLMISTQVKAAEILYIGDSHSYIASLNSTSDSTRRFGHILIQGLEALGHQVSYYAACGSEPGDWVSGSSTQCGYTMSVAGEFQAPRTASFPGIRSIYRPEQHSHLMINLGDNMFDWRTVGSKRVASTNAAGVGRVMSNFLAKIPEATVATCSWVGPTYHLEGSNYRKSNQAVDELYVVLEASLADKCRLIDSRSMVVPVVPNDGLHHVNADSQAWAQGVLSVF